MMPYHTKGMTLIEVVIAIAILGILAALAGPSFVNLLAQRRVIGVANELAADMQFARSQAVARNTTVTLNVDTSATYSIVATAGTVSLKSVSLASGTTLGTGSVIFDGMRGMPTGTYTQKFTVSNSSTASQLAVTVNLMGRPSICAETTSWGGFPKCS